MPSENSGVWMSAIGTSAAVSRFRDVLSFRSEAPNTPTSFQDLLAYSQVIRWNDAKSSGFPCGAARVAARGGSQQGERVRRSRRDYAARPR
jgi:hypothetical protein